jgi:hypothetical protein
MGYVQIRQASCGKYFMKLIRGCTNFLQANYVSIACIKLTLYPIKATTL